MKVINGLKMYTTADLQEMLGCAVGFVRKIRLEGQIRFTKIGGKIYFSEDALTEYLQGRTATSEKKDEINK